MKMSYSITFEVDSKDPFDALITKETMHEILTTFEEFRKLLDTANIQYDYHHEIRS